jgi:hypothetical protein
MVKQLVVVGTANGKAGSSNIRAKIRSSDGSVANISYRKLDVTAGYEGEHASAWPLNVEVFGGYVSLNAEATLSTTPRFNLAASTRNVSVEQMAALASRRSGRHAARVPDRRPDRVGRR